MTLPVPVIFILLAVLFLVFNFIFALAFAISYPPSENIRFLPLPV
jgi:NADH:ubiquinone oxidoreductase subunit 3 (subunit A)